MGAAFHLEVGQGHHGRSMVPLFHALQERLQAICGAADLAVQHIDRARTVRLWGIVEGHF